MSGRHILTTSPLGRREVKDVIQGIFVGELLHPSSVLWVVSPWISDIMVIDDQSGRFRFLNDSGQSRVRLSEVLRSLVSKGTKLRVVTRPDASNETFLIAVRAIQDQVAESEVRVVTTENIHAKGLVGDGYALTGSMNLTWSGIQKWDELVHFQAGAAASEVRMKFEEGYD